MNPAGQTERSPLRVFRGYTEERIRDPADHPFYQWMGRATLIFTGSTRNFETPPVRGSLSVRTVYGGSVWHALEGVPAVLKPGTCLVINDGQEYAVRIRQDAPVRTLSVHFSKAAVGQAVAAHGTADIDDCGPDDPNGVLPEFGGRLHAGRTALASALDRLALDLAGEPEDALALEADVLDVLRALVAMRAPAAAEVQRLPLVRRPQRLEIHRRLCRVRDFVRSCPGEELSIARLARVASLSPFHFQRLFRALEGCSVQQFVRGVRLGEARAMIEAGADSLIDVALAVGYHDHGSFTRAFRRHHGVVPSALRHRK